MEAYWSPGKRSTDGNKRDGEYRGILKGDTYVHHWPQVCQKTMTVLRYQRVIRAPYLKLKLNLWRRSEDPKLICLLSPLLLLAGHGMSIGKKTVSILHLGNQAMNSVCAAGCNQNV